MKILFAATEVHPFIRTGGLGDVMGALPTKLSELGNDIKVILPMYSAIDVAWKNKMTFIKSFNVKVGWRNQYCGIFKVDHKDVTFYFIDNEYYFKRHGVIYGHGDDAERFAFFNRAVLEMIRHIGWNPDIINCNDWQCGMIPALLKLEYKKDKFYENTKVIYTIHNLLFQGVFGKEILPDLFGYDMRQYENGMLKFDEGVSFMKAGIMYADKITTVSNTYAQEIKTKEYGERLEAILRDREHDLVGIVNGIDYDEYSSTDNKFIEANYSLDDMGGKLKCKEAIQKELGLEVRDDIPVISIISRLTNQKGIDLLIKEIEFLASMNMQLIILGTGDRYYEEAFSYLCEKYKGKIATIITFNTALSHRIYAGSDMFLMPSRFEPCGLGQLIALRYGTVPIVRETGGLKDTIENYDEKNHRGNGFSFERYDSYELVKTILRAISVFANKKEWNLLVKNAMNSDNSWDISAIEYLNLYNVAIEGK